MKFEDFYPISDIEAYIVEGVEYNELSTISKVKYVISDGKVDIVTKSVMDTQPLVRLGNIYEDRLYYCTERKIYAADEYIRNGHQPFMTVFGLLYQKDTSIFLDDECLIDKENGTFTSIGRPSMEDEWVYYEAREGDWIDPSCWCVWRYHIETGVKEKLKSNAANPYVYDGKLFYSHWINGGFITKVEALDENR